ncbi:hypothetical protein LV779_35215 [Streptomyces thinghirensis]|nr:hypothetical protein [Streptomyces thinghirensis]
MLRRPACDVLKGAARRGHRQALPAEVLRHPARRGGRGRPGRKWRCGWNGGTLLPGWAVLPTA